MSDGALEWFSTASVRPAERLDYWNDLACETYPGLAVDAADRSRFRGDMKRLRLGPLSMAAPGSNSATVRHGHGRSSRASSRFFLLQLQHHGCSRSRHRGVDQAMAPGDFVLLDTADPYVTSFTGDVRMITFMLQPQMVLDRIPGIEDHTGRVMSAADPRAALLSSFVRSTWENAELADFAGDWEALQDALLRIMEIAYRAGEAPANESSSLLHWRRRACALINARLSDPDLRVATVAEALGVSPRFLQMVFARAGTTPRAYLIERRLEKAAERLRAGERSITETAMDAGFCDLSSFDRAFRRRFGETPRRYRALQGGVAANDLA